MRIALDGNEANVLQRVGSNVYAFELIQALYGLVEQRDDVTVTVLLARPPVVDLPEATDFWRYKVVGPAKWWTQFAAPMHLWLHKGAYDVYFTPGHYAPRICPIPYISAVMDAAYLKYPEQFRPSDLLQLKHWTKYSVKHAAKVLVISKSTQRDVVTKYGRKVRDTVVAYPALVDNQGVPKKAERSAILEDLNIDAPFFLYVGTMQPRKNVVQLIKAFELFRGRSKKKYQLVLAGKIGWLADEIVDAVANSEYRSDIVMPGFITDEQKWSLYKEAEALCLVGLYEGFGMPALEAMSVGTIPIVSDGSSLPEVVGDGGLLVDPTDPEAIAKGMGRLVSMTKQKQKTMRTAAKKHTQSFSWGESAAAVLEALEKIADHAK